MIFYTNFYFSNLTKKIHENEFVVSRRCFCRCHRSSNTYALISSASPTPSFRLLCLSDLLRHPTCVVPPHMQYLFFLKFRSRLVVLYSPLYSQFYLFNYSYLLFRLTLLLSLSLINTPTNSVPNLTYRHILLNTTT